ncbi:MAG TPA: flagellar biosynthesis anti-sigma factor FlgM [Povalibacter sp.]
MTIKIGNYQNRPVQAGTDKSVTRAAGDASSAAADGTVAQGSPVQITGQARQLAALEQAVQGLPIVNEARVAEISSAIEEGRYQVNPERIADKLLRAEQDLGTK